MITLRLRFRGIPKLPYLKEEKKKHRGIEPRTTYLASRANARTPATKGEAAEVPVCSQVHVPNMSVVICKKEREREREIAR
jgi:hypothetical protein